ncbi:hypothetical protein [Actinobacillus pleuropneumoniae]|uniref:Uncharacterized protein n=1 Tax=Actinobacillus pleuropneumoniae TaxID=715 RepID=A0A448TZE3_ACTPL|nr:hypothetical protein [Actinobacillus pleuropneumoniae]EFL77756.1 hypothetical protein APP2_0806 [Actinobacillus pleuropneumoniae serovar 2 str. 4226]EFM87597.1 hypothetical protein appser2_10070 [Actinobacillus pleuropneumoniae serovar 2 str. S1536]MEE3618169.1 hypothetical protein [Actinobacillus pleuropneumoniae]UKH09279.1 hypothetical protein KZH40_05130 [Actinobacillus pleuropneumoniae]UKH45724.1 hypothetical protein D1095_05155 [Actinobacillus pleuropneumoniae serovar 2 str. S1536]
MAKKPKSEVVTDKKIETAEVTLRAFKINNPNATTATSQVREKLESFLESEHSAEQRCLILNPDDENKEQDLISDYSSKGKQQSLFCTLLRMKLGNGVQHITDDLLSEHKFSINDLKQRTIKTAGIYQRHYYFSILGDYLVTAGMPLNQTIKQLQTYLAWLLNDETLEIIPMIEPPKECKLSDLASATFTDPEFNDVPQPQSEQTNNKEQPTTDNSPALPVENTRTKRSWLNTAVIKELLPKLMREGSDFKEIEDLAKIISAELVVKFKKPRGMAQQDYEKILGATLKPVSDIENVQFKTKDKKRIVKGKDLLKMKKVEIEKTNSGYLIEEQLIQAMAHYLQEISQ